MHVHYLSSRTVLIADLNPNNLEVSIKSAIAYYREVYGEPRRIWVNGKDLPDELKQVDNLILERRGGCARGKIMVM